MPDSPTSSWLPETRRTNAIDVDENERAVRIHAQHLPQPTRFGAVPEGWTITIANTAGNRWTFETEQVAADVTWHFPGADQAVLTLSPQMRVVHLSLRRANNRATINLTGNASRLYLGTGTYHVNGDHDYDITANAPNGRVTVQGAARPRRLTGSGEVHMPDLVMTDVDLDGDLTIANLAPTGDSAPTVVVNSLTVGSKRKDGQLRGPSVVEADGSLTVHGTVTGPVILSADSIRISKHVKGSEPEETRITAASRLHVTGSCDDATLATDGPAGAAIVVGSFPTIKGLALPIDDDGALTDNRPVDGNGSPVSGSKLHSSGPILVGSTTGTIVEAEGPVIVLGDLVHTSPVSGPVVHTDGFVFVEDQTSLNGGLIRGSDVLLRRCDSVRIEQTDNLRTGGCTGSKLTGKRLTVTGDVVSSELHATRRLAVDGAVDDDSTLVVGGSGELGGPVQGHLEWRDPLDGDQLVIEDNVAAVRFCAGSPPADLDSLPQLVIQPTGNIGALDIDGAFTVDVPPEERAADNDLTVDTRLHSEAHLRLLRRTTRAIQLDLRLDTPGASLDYRSDAGDPLVVRLPVDDADSHLEMSATGAIKLVPRSSPEGEVPSHPQLSLIGGALVEVDTELRHVSCSPVGGSSPLLDLTEGGAVLDLVGTVRLGNVDGRINGARPTWRNRVRRRARRLHLVQRRVEPDSSSGRSERPPVVLALATQKREGFGHVYGVDPTRLRFAELRHLGQLHVFEPDPDALMDAAARYERDPFRLRSRAQRMTAIADHVVSSAASGTSRSAALWAASRAHHAAASSRVEKLLRGVHRLLGYSQRPLPALFTWLALVVSGAALLHWLLPGSSGCFSPEEHVALPYGFVEQFERVLLLPTTLLRLSQGGASGYPPLLCSGVAHVAGVVLVGVAAAFFVVALRNYLRSPVDT